MLRGAVEGRAFMKAPRLRAGLVLFVGVAAVLGSTFGLRVAVADEQDLETALSDYAAGRNEEALAKLREYVEGNPGDEEVLAVLRRADERVLLRVLSMGNEHERLLKYLLDKSRAPARDSAMDDAEIQALVKTATEEDSLDRRHSAAVRLRAAGELAVPYLYPYLGADAAAQVVNAMFALERLGLDGVHPLAEVLESDDATIRRTAAAVLGNLREPQAVPALLRLKETDDNEGVRASAIEALRKIGQNRATTIAAANAFTRLGERYYSNDPTIVLGFDQTRNMWRWQDGQLVRVEVPAYLYPYQMAEQMAVDALTLDPSHRGARALLVRALLAQGVEAEIMLANEQDAPEALARAQDLAASQGFSGATDALRTSLKARDWDVAVEAIRLVVRTYTGEPLNSHPLGAALQAPERRVRYEAAIAALHMSPKSGMPNADKVAALAAQAASEAALRQVLVVDDRDETRSRLVMDAAHDGYVAAGESDGARAVARAKGSPTLDVIVIRADLGDPNTTIPSRRHTSALTVIDELKDDARTRDMRILVLVQETMEQDVSSVMEFFQNKYGDDVAGFITVPIDTLSAMEVLGEAASAGTLNPDRQRANELAARAADAFAETDFTCRSFNLDIAVEPLVTAATDGPTPEVRINAVRALGNIRQGGGAALKSVLEDGENDEIKAAAATALGAVLSRHSPGEGEVEALMTAADGEGAVADAALAALGQVRDLTAEQRLEVFNKHRLEIGETR